MSIPVSDVRRPTRTAHRAPSQRTETAMTKYVLTYHGGADMPDDPAQQETIMAAWGAWFGQLGDQVVDGGNPFGPAVTIAPDGSTSDGGITPNLGGFSVITAADLDAAVGAAKGCPVLANGGSVQVSEAIEM